LNDDREIDKKEIKEISFRAYNKRLPVRAYRVNQLSSKQLLGNSGYSVRQLNSDNYTGSQYLENKPTNPGLALLDDVRKKVFDERRMIYKM